MTARIGHRVLLLAGVAAVVRLAIPAGASASPGVESGRAVVVSSADTGASSRERGGSRTQFSLRLPSGSSCPGDSANDGYRVQSFIVPAADDVATLTYRSVSPQVPGGYALYDLVTNPFIQAQTADARAPGQPGLIINIPNFSFAVFPPGRLPPGRYHVGIACSLHNTTVRYWSTDLLLSAAPDDQPAHLRWQVADLGSTHHRGVLTPVLIAAAGISSVATIALWRRRSAALVPAKRSRQ